MIKTRPKWIWLSLLFGVAALCAGAACHSKPSGPGMIVSFGSVIEGKRIYVKSSKMSNGQLFSNPGSVGGVGTSKWGSWRHIPTAVEAASGDGRGLPEWVELVWQELEYPEPQPADFSSNDAYSKYVREEFSRALIKAQRLEIKSRIPQDVVDEVIESKRKTGRGKLAEKSLWVYIFWTPEGVKMRWELLYDKDHKEGGFGHLIREGGDDLDRYNR